MANKTTEVKIWIDLQNHLYSIPEELRSQNWTAYLQEASIHACTLMDELGIDQKSTAMFLEALTSPALKYQSEKGGRSNYPANFRGRVPLKVRVAKNVSPDMMEFAKELEIKEDTICLKDNEYFVWVNSYGAVSSILPNGEKLGLLPSEFNVTEWH